MLVLLLHFVMFISCLLTRAFVSNKLVINLLTAVDIPCFVCCTCEGRRPSSAFGRRISMLQELENA